MYTKWQTKPTKRKREILLHKQYVYVR